MRKERRQYIFIGAGAAAVFLCAFVLTRCGHPPAAESGLFRLLDGLGAAKIVQSPFLGSVPALTPEAKEAFYPVNSEPLGTTPSGPNPYELGRKMRYGGADFSILFAPAPSAYLFDRAWAAGDVLEFGIGIKRDAHSERLRKAPAGPASDAGEVAFAVGLERDGREKEIFFQALKVPPPGEESRLVFNFYRVVLPDRAERTRLFLRTRGPENAFAFWVQPVLFRPRTDAVNVILISLDTLRADHLGCYGYHRPTSPSIDALAADSALFLRTYAPSSWTLPSHVSIMTGLVGPSHRVVRDDERMDPALVTLAEILRLRGYFCWATTGGGFVSAKFGFEKGFDFYSETEGDIDNLNSAELMERAASSWLEGHADRPFFLFLHTYQVHPPYRCPAPYNRMFLDKDALWDELNIKEYLGGHNAVFRPLSDAERRNAVGLYDGEIRYTDEAFIGPLVAKLKALGLYDRTLLILLSDHGEEFYEHGSWMHTNQLYEESLRVPLLVKFPGSRFRGLRHEGAVRLVDVFPTVLEEIGVKPGTFPCDGESLFPILRGRESEDRPVWSDIAGNLVETHNSAKAGVIEGIWKVVWNTPYASADLGFFRFSPPSVPPVELYDLARDPGEKTSLTALHPDVVRRLAALKDGFLALGGKSRTVKADLDEELKAKLRALGYIR